MRCVNGHENPDGQRFCGECADPLVADEPTPAIPDDSSAEGSVVERPDRDVPSLADAPLAAPTNAATGESTLEPGTPTVALPIASPATPSSTWRSPWVRYVAIAAGVLLIIGAIVAAASGGSNSQKSAADDIAVAPDPLPTVPTTPSQCTSSMADYGAEILTAQLSSATAPSPSFASIKAKNSLFGCKTADEWMTAAGRALTGIYAQFPDQSAAPLTTSALLDRLCLQAGDVAGTPYPACATRAVIPTTTTTAPPPPTAPPAPVNSSCMSLDEFNQISAGMTHDEVTGIVGGPGTVVSQSDLAGYTTILYGWTGCGGIGANSNVMFQNDAEINKAQFGLR